MPVVSKDCLKLAVLNTARHGDTDIFPYPIENHIMHDLPDDVVSVLVEIDSDFDAAIAKIPIICSTSLSVVGYSGFRLGTQIDPIWNTYLLGLVLMIGKEIEDRRLGSTMVFSYRFKPSLDEATLFDKDTGWVQFQEAAHARAENSQFVLRCDISDFYSRIYHHRLENALKQATPNGDVVKRIMTILAAISDGASYGLPVGGPASRLLSELLLNRVDRLLVAESIEFCRFVDDFVIFAKDRESAYSSLITLSGLLLSNEGLSLQKSKTRLMSMQEFLGTSEFARTDAPTVGDEEETRAFRRLRIHYDPYSPTAVVEYAKLKKELERFDIVGMLGRELAKSKIDEGLTRRLVGAVRHLPFALQSDAVFSMLKSLDLLYPIFPTVMLVCKSLLAVLDPATKEQIFVALRELIVSNSYITQVPTNLNYALRVLAADYSEETEVMLSALYKRPLNIMLRRDIILMMAHRRADHWVSNCRRSFGTLSQWERRALLVSSYILQDEGSHWRDAVKRDLSSFDRLVLKWAAQAKQKNPIDWRVPV